VPIFLSNLLDYFFYKRCYLCSRKADKNLLCGKCFKTLCSKGYKRQKLVKGIEIEGYFTYQDEIQQLIRAIKYHNKIALAGDIAEILYKFLVEQGFSGEDIVLIPVPLHPKRQKKRKYNHIEAICEEFSKLSSCKTNIDLIKRVKNTRVQYKLSPQERRANIKDAFKVFPEFYSGKKLIIVDDICTTGVTIEELIKELKKNNIHNVAGLVISFSRSSF